jgi:hypothetical protein
LGLVILFCSFTSSAYSDTIVIKPGTGEGDPFSGPITIQVVNGAFSNEYINTTGRAILDLHIEENPPFVLEALSEFFSVINPGPPIEMYAGTGPGIAAFQVFEIDVNGAAGLNLSMTVTPTFTGTPEPSPTILLGASFAAMLALRASRPFLSRRLH